MLKIFKMINVKIRILRGLLEEAINNIDAGNSNHTEEELSEIIDDLTKLNRGIKRISKTYACEKILHCSPSTFDTYVKLGIIPPGHKEVGFKELSWSEKDFDEATLNKIRTQLIPPTVATQPQVNVWEEIDKEIASLTNDQKQILAQDQTYAGIEQELQFLIQQELINSVKGKVANSARGKELLDMQLKNIKDKKAKIVEEANKEAELFKKFQIATQANPNLTYAEFIKNVNGK